MTDNTAAVRNLVDAMETEVYFGFNLRVEMMGIADNDPETFAALCKVFTKVRAARQPKSCDCSCHDFDSIHCATCRVYTNPIDPRACKFDEATESGYCYHCDEYHPL
jgi:hypothetical protein